LDGCVRGRHVVVVQPVESESVDSLRPNEPNGRNESAFPSHSHPV
jgi:hypothetical protein